jgi:hypothetical protein
MKDITPVVYQGCKNQPDPADLEITTATLHECDLTFANVKTLIKELMTVPCKYTKLKLRYRAGFDWDVDRGNLLLRLFLAISICPTIYSVELCFEKRHTAAQLPGGEIAENPYGGTYFAIAYVSTEIVPLQLLQVLQRSPYICVLVPDYSPGENIWCLAGEHAKSRVYGSFARNLARQIMWSIASTVLSCYKAVRGSASVVLASSVLTTLGLKDPDEQIRTQDIPMLDRILRFAGVADEQDMFHPGCDSDGDSFEIDMFQELDISRRIDCKDESVQETMRSFITKDEWDQIDCREEKEDNCHLTKGVHEDMSQQRTLNMIGIVNKFVDSKFFQNELALATASLSKDKKRKHD